MSGELMCCHKVRKDGGFRPVYVPCKNKAKVEVDGKAYCGTHDPVTRKKKDDERFAARQAQWEASTARLRLSAAAPDLLDCLTMGAELNTPDMLDWVADRLVSVHGESPFVDFVVSLRNRANAMRKAIAKAKGEPHA